MENETRIALIGIIVEAMEATEQLNHILHDYSDFIIGRMGIPYREKGLSNISIAMDAPSGKISSLAGKLGQISGLSVKTIYSKTGGNG